VGGDGSGEPCVVVRDCNPHSEETGRAKCWWLMPVKLATWEAESGRSWVKASPGKQ
jgi:hypothetical protein